MALTGELAFRGLTISNAHLRVMDCDHRVVDRSTEDEDGNVTWSKVLIADYSARIYKDADAYAANPDQAVTTISGSFTPSVANDANLNIIKQTYEHIKTLADYDDLTDA
jgi:rRNA maturation endonuclease Nob1